MNLLLFGAAIAGVNQPTTNLKLRRISANTNVTSKKLKFAPEDGFSEKIYVV